MITFVTEGDSSDIGNVVMIFKRGEQKKTLQCTGVETRYVTSNKVYSNTHFSGLNNHNGCGAWGKAAKQINLTLILSNNIFKKD